MTFARPASPGTGFLHRPRTPVLQNRRGRKPSAQLRRQELGIWLKRRKGLLKGKPERTTQTFFFSFLSFFREIALANEAGPKVSEGQSRPRANALNMGGSGFMVPSNRLRQNHNFSPRVKGQLCLLSTCHLIRWKLSVEYMHPVELKLTRNNHHEGFGKVHFFLGGKSL